MKPNLVSFSEASKYIYHSKTLLVDLRSREAFATSHISGAWNIPYEELSQSAGGERTGKKRKMGVQYRRRIRRNEKMRLL